MKNERQLSGSRLLVLGANGGIGRQVTEQALKQGHHVTAILRNPGKLEIRHAHLTIIQGDVMKTAAWEKHLQDKDAIISAIGKTSFKKTNLYSEGNRNLIDAMQRNGTSRVFFISASGLEVNPSHSPFVKFATKYILQKLLKNMYADLERMEKIIKASPLNWTIMRPPELTNKPLTEQYRFSVNHFLQNGLRISRADLAHFILNHLSDETIYRTTVEVAY